MADKFDPERASDILESASRRAAMPPERTLRSLGLRRGMSFVDAGAGSGYFTTAAADLVGPEGRVYALDVEERMLSLLRAKKLPPWVEVMACSESALPLPDGVADFTFACFVLHETQHPVLFLCELGRAAKRRTPVVLLEWTKRRQPEGPPYADRLHHHRVEALLHEAGLSFRKLEFLNPSQYAVTAFRK